LIVGVVIVGALAGGVINDLTNSSNFSSARSLQYDASSAVNLAIQEIRYTPLLQSNQTLNASPPSSCTTSSPYVGHPNSSAKIDVWCSTVWNPGLATTRVVTLSACPDPNGTVTAVSCASAPLLQAVVTFDDYPAGINAPSTAECVVYCGTAETVNSWIYSPVVPTVSSVVLTTPATPGSGPISGGTSITINGTGFASGSTVNFVEESGGTPTSDNMVLSATSSTVLSSTVITATSPSVTEGTTYFVTVTTPNGTTATTATSPTGSTIFTYVATTPTISSTGGVTPNSGVATTGGTSIAIAGTGFYSGATVDFTEVGNSTVVLPGIDVSVTSDTAMTVVTPSVTSSTPFYVTVTTPAGTSSLSSNAEVTYASVYPVVASISPVTGTSGDNPTVTITGTGFETGATVAFVPEAGGTTLNATNVSVIKDTDITVSWPAGMVTGGSYYVTVTITLSENGLPGDSGTSSTAVFTY
jgi:hypothetical protein